jgi:flagellar biosynthesis/type III secretory pathway protein FliH
MSSITHLLPEFSQGPITVSLTEEEEEERRLAAFEEGYAAGWEDSAKAYGQEKGQSLSDLASSLADIHFTFQDAYSAILKEMEPVLRKMIDAVLPELATRSIGAHAVAELMNTLKNTPGVDLTITAHPSAKDRIATALHDATMPPVHLLTDDGFSPSQLIIGTESAETEINFETVFKGLEASLATLLHAEPKDARHG